MDASLLKADEFNGFGPFGLMPRRRVTERRFATSPDPAAMRRLIRQEVPRRSGIYGMLDGDGRLIYVGKAKSLCNRLLSYFTGQDEESKSLMIGQRARTVLWEPLHNELAALLRELELIRRFRPILNVRSQPGRVQPMYVCVGREPAPYVILAATPPPGKSAAYGPVRATRRVREVIQQINVLFQLRDCPQGQKMAFADQLQLFDAPLRAGCLRLELGTCLGPCAAGCTRADYAQRVREVRSFLEGSRTRVLNSMRESMQQAAAGRQYERAMSLRDIVQDIEWFCAHLHRLRHVQKTYNFVYRARSPHRVEQWCLVRNGQICRIFRKPRSERDQHAALKLVARVFGPGADSMLTPREDVEHTLLLAQWFSRRTEELARAWSPQEAMRQLQAWKLQPSENDAAKLFAATGHEDAFDSAAVPPVTL